MKPWSKLKKELVKLWDDSINLDIHQSVYRMDSERGSTDLPRYFITLNKEIIFDFPKDFKEEILKIGYSKGNTLKHVYPYDGAMSHLSDVIREYIDTPKNELLEKKFKGDFDLSLFLKVADKRIGKERLKELSKQLPETHKVQKIIQARIIDKNENN